MPRWMPSISAATRSILNGTIRYTHGPQSSNSYFCLSPKLDFGQKFNGLAMVRGAKYGVREFLYCHGQAGTVKKFTGVSGYPANYAPPRAAKIGQSQA